MTASTVDIILGRIGAFDEEECSRLLTAFLAVRSHSDRARIIEFAEVIGERETAHKNLQ